jgi:hypothetical protein
MTTLIRPPLIGVDGFQGITLTSATDVDNDGEADYTNPAALLTTTYRIMDLNGDGRRELRRTTNGGGQLGPGGGRGR